MASPISPKDILDLTKFLYKQYGKYLDAPQKMRESKKQIDFVEILVKDMMSLNQLDYLNLSNGAELYGY